MVDQAPTAKKPTFKRQWRFYKTAAGGEVVAKALDALGENDAAALLAEMRVVAKEGLKDGGARHLRGDIWEVRTDGEDVTLRALFAKEGRYGQVLLALDVFTKKTQQTPKQKIDLAEKRHADWVRRGQAKRSGDR